MTQPIDLTRRITRRRTQTLPPKPALTDGALRLACGLLRANRIVVLDEDWRFERHRLGVVAKDGPTLCFVAVAAHGEHGGHTRAQARIRLRAAAGGWLRRAGATRLYIDSLRFDVISSAIGPDGSFELRHDKGVA